MSLFLQKLPLESLFSRLLTSSPVHKILLHTQQIVQRSAEEWFSVQEYQLVKKQIKGMSGNSSQNCPFTLFCFAVSETAFSVCRRCDCRARTENVNPNKRLWAFPNSWQLNESVPEMGRTSLKQALLGGHPLGYQISPTMAYIVKYVTSAKSLTILKTFLGSATLRSSDK